MQVALETYSGEKAFSKSREDKLLAEHFDDQRSTIEGYKAMADLKAGEIAHYLLLLYKKVIEGSLVKHSKRPSSEEVQ